MCFFHFRPPLPSPSRLSILTQKSAQAQVASTVRYGTLDIQSRSAIDFPCPQDMEYPHASWLMCAWLPAHVTQSAGPILRQNVVALEAVPFVAQDRSLQRSFRSRRPTARSIVSGTWRFPMPIRYLSETCAFWHLIILPLPVTRAIHLHSSRLQIQLGPLHHTIVFSLPLRRG